MRLLMKNYLAYLDSTLDGGSTTRHGEPCLTLEKMHLQGSGSLERCCFPSHKSKSRSGGGNTSMLARWLRFGGNCSRSFVRVESRIPVVRCPSSDPFGRFSEAAVCNVREFVSSSISMCAPQAFLTINSRNDNAALDRHTLGLKSNFGK